MQTILNNIEDRAKWLYAYNAGAGIEDMKKYVNQAINELPGEDDWVYACSLFDVTYDEYVESIAKRLLKAMHESK